MLKPFLRLQSQTYCCYLRCDAVCIQLAKAAIVALANCKFVKAFNCICMHGPATDPRLILSIAPFFKLILYPYPPLQAGLAKQ